MNSILLSFALCYDILRLRRQQQLIFESDEDDDDDETTASTSESRSDRLPHPTKKLNGLQRGSSNVTTSTAAHRSLRTYQADYINKRQHYENGANSDENDNYEVALEENNNEQNNNDIFVNDHSSQYNGQQTPPRTGLNNNRGLTTTNGTTNSLPINTLFTPDSGISLNNSNTPITGGLFLNNYHNDTMASTSRASTRLSPCLQVNDFDSNDKSGTHYDDEGVVVNRSNNNNNNNNGNSNGQNTTRVNVFQQKVSRIRRNYAKQFAGDDSESD
uniref:Uncharacterized protein n=1 Tax=Glossina brevipalpis TaxID=37001 RepID=A0A1A9WB77_9MUSC